MGLGLGYVEILAAASFLKFAVLDSAGGESFEIVPELRDWFRAWVFGVNGEVPKEFLAMYDEILKRTSEHFELSSETVRHGLKTMLENGRWTINGALSNSTKFNSSFGCICFDAFSAKTSPDLWSEEFLKNFLLSAADPGSVLSTYACTGALKRALKSGGFELNIREGFASKRDSTFAVRRADAGTLML
jgi:tRNA U34 5-methylaminomethyl-2-thiouridine-forming methyltransferase MnmC